VHGDLIQQRIADEMKARAIDGPQSINAPQITPLGRIAAAAAGLLAVSSLSLMHNDTPTQQETDPPVIIKVASSRLEE